MATGRTMGRHPDHALERTLLSLAAAAFLLNPLDFDAFLAELRRFIPLCEPMTQSATTQE